jgi:preprotein translocase subunit SecD
LVVELQRQLFAPFIQRPIVGGEGHITGIFNKATELAACTESGALSVNLTPEAHPMDESDL